MGELAIPSGDDGGVGYGVKPTSRDVQVLSMGRRDNVAQMRQRVGDERWGSGWDTDSDGSELSGGDRDMGSS